MPHDGLSAFRRKRPDVKRFIVKEKTVASVTGTDASETLDRADGVTDNADTILGLGGNDTIFGLGGSDYIKGGGGADRINGGGGIDTASYSDSDEGVFVDLDFGLGAGGTAEGDVLTSIENLEGSSYGDFLALQLPFFYNSDSMGDHDSEVMGWLVHRSRRRWSSGRNRCGM
jgi:Ca2+-binding RTX toxin-like protein